MGQPNFFSKFSAYSYLSRHDWSYPEEEYPYNPKVIAILPSIADNQIGYIPNLSDF